ncbi:hypothetical protein Vadar_016789 [Vaccinium darrowii]|uniref:Uncharacterized protein n=1 Tax=Vaccinium darrowii TaxID=229202 RepID=A0ACB7ZKC3_9ERIC|nr:hypothetical protein Vadar_016789 [Vaccinium darrowii]
MSGTQWRECDVVKGMGAGILLPRDRIKRVGTEGIKVIGRDVICDEVKELMGGKQGRRARERAQELEPW